MIWVAESFRPEHVAALEFLNQNTTEALSFFAVEVELWRIGDSPLAPKFEVVAKPNDWAKSGRDDLRHRHPEKHHLQPRERALLRLHLVDEPQQ